MKRLIKKLTALLAMSAVITPAAHAAGGGQWRTHSTFDNDVSHIFVGSDRVYMLGLAQEYDPKRIMNAKKQYFLYAYDKDNDEMVNFTRDNYLNHSVISAAEYNPSEGYLVVVYDDYDIDIIYDDGTRKNIPSYKSQTMSESKNVNSMTFDTDNGRIYLATDFGYLALNEKKGEIAESRNYGRALQSIAKVGDKMLLLTADGKLLESGASDPRLSITDYNEVHTVDAAHRLLPLSDTICVLVSGGGTGSDVYRVDVTDKVNVTPWLKTDILNIEKTPGGYSIGTRTNLISFHEDGTRSSLESQREDWGYPSATSDMREIWYGAPRKGLRSKNYDVNGPTWSLTRDFMRPNAASPFLVTSMRYTPDNGLLIANHGTNYLFMDKSVSSPLLLSGWKDGSWSEYSPAYNNTEQTNVLFNPNGLAIDPDDPDLVYFGSYMNGIVRVDMSDPKNILHISRPGDPNASLPGFVAMVPDQYGVKFDELCHFSAPEFDSAGRLWSSYNDVKAQKSYPHLTLYYWDAADRRASADASSFRPWKVLEVKGTSPSNIDCLLPLKRTPNVIVYAIGTNKSDILVIDHGGTPEDTSDDRIARLTTDLHNSDGEKIGKEYVYSIFEDQATGMVWVGHETGVFYFDPETIFDNPNLVNLVKVPRNDGTNLADYLLFNVPVYNITSDTSGRKWFSTGGGLVCTSGDGREIFREYTVENSSLPNNIVYTSCYNPAANSMMISTASGLSELYLSGMSSGSGDMNSARAYPNPVRPDYYGYVTIDGLADNALVKIVDASGNLVRELDRASGGETKWDATNFNHNKVGSGVYYVMASAGDSSNSMAKVAKILIVR